jgi:hypothetical protein
VPDLRPAVTADQIRGYPVQPRPGARTGGVVPVPLPESEQERLRHHVVGRIRADAAGHIPLDLIRVPAEHDLEYFGLTPGPLDDYGIIFVGGCPGL